MNPIDTKIERLRQDERWQGKFRDWQRVVLLDAIKSLLRVANVFDHNSLRNLLDEAEFMSEQHEECFLGTYNALYGNANEQCLITDGFGNHWSAYCEQCGRKSRVVVRPGKVQCPYCD